MINLKEAGQHQELGDGSLYMKLQGKMPEPMLARYHRRVFEYNKEESVLALREWIMQESEFQTIASETVSMFSGKFTNASLRNAPKYGNQRTFFGEAKNGHTFQKTPCQDCGMYHGIWNCPDFIRRRVAERWNVAKQNQLCYRCLAQGHQGRDCPRSRPCGQDGCTDLHHRLLHKKEHKDQIPYFRDNTKVKRIEKTGLQDMKCPPTDSYISPTEGNEQTTMVTQNNISPSFTGLRTVPVILKNGDRSLKINALLDDASMKTYVNANIAKELGFQGRTEIVKASVLNGQVETIETKPIDVTLQSVTGSVSMKVNAYTVNKVTGNMLVVDWNRYKEQWPHLRNIDFLSSSKRPIIDILIGTGLC